MEILPIVMSASNTVRAPLQPVEAYYNRYLYFVRDLWDAQLAYGLAFCFKFFFCIMGTSYSGINIACLSAFYCSLIVSVAVPWFLIPNYFPLLVCHWCVPMFTTLPYCYSYHTLQFFLFCQVHVRLSYISLPNCTFSVLLYSPVDLIP